MGSSTVQKLKLNNFLDNFVTVTGSMSVFHYVYYVMPNWLFNKNYPMVISHESPHGGIFNDEYRVSQESFIRGGRNIGYYIPFTYTEENHIDFETSWPERSESFWLRPGTSSPFTVSKDSNWFVCNVQQIGEHFYFINSQL